MKRVLAIMLLSAVLVATAFVGTWASAPRRTIGQCYDTWEACRTEAFARDASVIQTTLMLTLCDIGLGRCILYG